MAFLPGQKEHLSPQKLSTLTLAITIFFVVSGGPFQAEQVVGKVGPSLGLLFLLLAPVVWAGPVALITAELTARFPEEGGYYVWVREGLGPFAGFLCAWWSWISSWVDVAIYPIVAVNYATSFLFKTPPIASTQTFLVYLIIAVFTVVNLFGIKGVGKTSWIMSWIIFLPFIVLIGYGLVAIKNGGAEGIHWPAASPGPVKIGAALVLSLWNFFGWDSITTTSAEVREGGTTLPRALLVALVLVTASVTFPIIAGIMINHHWSAWDNGNGYWPQIAATASKPLAVMIAIGGVVSGIGMFSANLLASSRIPYVLAQDGYLSPKILQLTPRFNTPWVGIMIGAVFAVAFARSSFQSLVGVDLSIYLAALILELGAFLALRVRGKSPDAGFKIGGGPIVAILLCLVPAGVAIGAIALQMSPTLREELDLQGLPIDPLLLDGILLGSGPMAYLILSRRFKKGPIKTC